MQPIETLLQQPEGKTLEFKRDLSSPGHLLKTLVSFANTAGGRLIIGVNDDHQILGVDDPLTEEERLCNLIADRIAPRLVPSIELFSQADKTLLIVNVYPINVRLGSSNRQADCELIAELKRSVSGHAFDEMPMPDLSRKDLDLDVLAQHIHPHKLNEQALRTLKLLIDHQGRWVPSKGAVLLFGRERS